MAEYSWDHVHIKTYDVTSSAKWLQDKLGAKPMHGTEITAARADMMLGGVRVLFTEVKQGDGTNATPSIPYAGFEHFGLAVKDITPPHAIRLMGYGFAQPTHVIETPLAATAAAFADTFIGLLPLLLPLSLLTQDPATLANLLLALSFVLSAYGAFLLGWELTKVYPAALVCGGHSDDRYRHVGAQLLASYRHSRPVRRGAYLWSRLLSARPLRRHLTAGISTDRCAPVQQGLPGQFPAIYSTRTLALLCRRRPERLQRQQY